MRNSVKQTRIERSLTQAQLAELVQVSRQTIISIETSRYLPSVLLSLKLARILAQKVEDLFVLEASDC